MSETRDTRWISLIVLCVGMLMIVLDGTVVNVALPSIQNDLGFSQPSLAWVVNAYLIAFGGLLLLAGRLGDLIGCKRVFISGLVVFTLASLLCGLACNQQTLIGARFLQGIGGAMASAVILAMIVTMFTEPAERAKAMGVFSFTASAGGSVGLLVGGTMTQLLNWHWVFLINVPIGVAAFFVAVRFLQGNQGIGLREGADALGALLVTGSLMIAVYTVVEVPVYGLTSGHTLGFGLVAIAPLIAFIVRQATTEKPLLRLSVFRSRNVTGSNLLEILIVAGMFGFFFLDSLYLRRVLSYGAVATSLNGNYLITIFPAMVLLGVGMGVSFPSLMMFAMSDSDSSNSGLISGLINTTCQVGGAFGLAILATAAAARTQSALAGGASMVAGLSAGYHLAFGVAAICMALATIIAATVLVPINVEKREDTQSPETA